ncbi:MAG: hypothetical protein AAF492_14600, partial [Verrucomicrobiota bacterium]
DPYQISRSPDGRWIVATTREGSHGRRLRKAQIGIWDARTGRLENMLFGYLPFDLIAPPRWSPDSRIVVTGGSDQQVSLWNPETGLRIRKLAGHSAFVQAYAFSPDGTRLASRDANGVVKLWHVDTGTELLSLQATPTPQTAPHLGWSPDGRTLLGDVDGGETWDASSGYAKANHPSFTEDLAVLASSASRRLITMREAAADYLKDAWSLMEPFHLDKMKADQAAQAVNQALLLEPDDPNIWMAWAISLYLGENWLLSLAKLEKAERIGSHDHPLEALAIRSTVAFHQGEREEAERWYGQLLEALPAHGASRSAQNLARITELTRIDDLIDRNKADDQLRRRRGELHLELENYPPVINQFFKQYGPEAMIEPMGPMLIEHPEMLDRLLAIIPGRVFKQQQPLVYEDLLAVFEADEHAKSRVRIRLAMDSRMGLYLEPPAAEAMVVSVLQDDPDAFNAQLIDHPDAGLQAGCYFADTRRWPFAARCLEAFLKVYPDHPWATATLEYVRSQRTTEQ